jgi:hypothetical protein
MAGGGGSTCHPASQPARAWALSRERRRPEAGAAEAPVGLGDLLDEARVEETDRLELGLEVFEERLELIGVVAGQKDVTGEETVFEGIAARIGLALGFFGPVLRQAFSRFALSDLLHPWYARPGRKSAANVASRLKRKGERVGKGGERPQPRLAVLIRRNHLD